MRERQAAVSRTLLVTGGSGYVGGGGLIRDALALGYRVRCLDLLIYGGRSLLGLMNHPNFEFVKGDIRDRKMVKSALEGVDAVVHLAAIVGDKPCQAAPRSAVQINYQGTELLAMEAHKRGVKHFVFASTCSNYGITDPDVFVGEDDALNPVSLYAETKIDSETLLTQMQSDRFKVTVLRFSTAFGLSSRTRFDLTVNSFSYEAFSEDRISVFAADMWRPYIHVHDMGRILLAILDVSGGRGGGIYNAGFTHMNYTKREIIPFLLECMPEVEVEFINTVDDRRSYRVDFTRLHSLLGLEPAKSVKNGFSEIIESFRNGILREVDYSSNKLDSLEAFFAANERKLSV